LGTPSALRKYLVKASGDGLAWSRGGAQPFAAKVNASSKYDQVDIWNEWIQEDWQAGAGQVDPEAGGFLFSMLETRVPGQIILPQAIRAHRHTPSAGAVTAGRQITYSPDQASAFTTVTVGTGGYSKLGWLVDYNEGTGGNIPIVWVERLTGTPTIKVAIYYDSAGSPGAALGAGEATIPAGVMGGWPLFWDDIGLDTFTDDYWYVIWTDTAASSFKVHCATTRAGSPSTKSYDAGVWTSRTVYPFFYGRHGATYDPYPVITDEATVFISGVSTSVGVFSEIYDTTGDELDTAATALGAAFLQGPPVYTFDLIFIPTEDGMYSVTSAGATFVNTGYASTKVAAGGGYLWRANNNTVYYTNDGTVWTTVLYVGAAPWVINSMAMLERDCINVFRYFERFGLGDEMTAKNWANSLWEDYVVNRLYA